jgi:uncharacterized RDD family membrane protein YckC
MTQHGDTADRDADSAGDGTPAADSRTVAAVAPGTAQAQPEQPGQAAQQQAPQQQAAQQQAAQQQAAQQQAAQQQAAQQPAPQQQAPQQQAPQQQAPQQHAAQQPAPQQPTPQQPAPQQPVFPSPYLEAGESVPHAYLAPPQPGLPSFGSSPAPPRPGARPFADPRSGGQQPYDQPPYAGTQNGRAPYGRQASRRPPLGMSQRPGRDPTLAAGWERLLAAILDWLLIMIVSTLVFLSPLLRIWRQLDAIAANYQNLSSPGAQTAISNFARTPATVSTLLHFWLAVFGIALAYYWVMHAVWGATVGKRLLRVAVVSSADRKKVGVRAAGIRAVAYLVAPAILLLVARVEYVGALLWLCDNGLLLLDARAQTGHDKLAGTIVISQRRRPASS